MRRDFSAPSPHTPPPAVARSLAGKRSQFRRDQKKNPLEACNSRGQVFLRGPAGRAKGVACGPDNQPVADCVASGIAMCGTTPFHAFRGPDPSSKRRFGAGFCKSAEIAVRRDPSGAPFSPPQAGKAPYRPLIPNERPPGHERPLSSVANQTPPLFYGPTEWSAAQRRHREGRPDPSKCDSHLDGLFFPVKTVPCGCTRPQFRGFIPAVA